MGQIALMASIATLAVLGWGLLKDLGNRIRPKQAADRPTIERQLKQKGYMKTDGTIAVDKELDAELNAVVKELNAAESARDTDLDKLENEE